MKRIIGIATLASCMALLTACSGAGLAGANSSSLLAGSTSATGTASSGGSGTTTTTTPASPTSTTSPSSTTASAPSGSASSGSGTTTSSTGSTTSSGSGATTGTSTGTTGSTTSTPASSLPTPPATAIVFDSVQNTTDNWSSCSDCAGGAVTSTFWTSPFQSTPSLSGSSRQFYISGPAWSSALWWKKFGAQNASSHFLWDFWVYFDDASAAKTWSAEYDLWQSMGGQEFMIGSQCDFGDGEWDMWDSLNNTWIKNSGVPCPRFTPNTWHHIQWYLERISSTQYSYNTLVVDGTPYTLNRTFTANPTNWNDNFGVQWQLDEDSSGTALNEWVDKVTVTIW